MDGERSERDVPTTPSALLSRHAHTALNEFDVYAVRRSARPSRESSIPEVYSARICLLGAVSPLAALSSSVLVRHRAPITLPRDAVSLRCLAMPPWVPDGS